MRCVGCLWPHGCSGRRRARPLCVPVGGGPPASRPRCELRSARRLEARPGPAAAHRHRGRSLRRPPHRWCLWFWCARPGPAAAHRHCGRTLRRPPHRRRCVAVNSPARPRRSQRAPQPGPAATAQVSCPDLTCRIAETVPNFARNSPATISNIEFRSLELQRFGALLNVYPIELRATFGGLAPPPSQFRMQFSQMSSLREAGSLEFCGF